MLNIRDCRDIDEFSYLWKRYWPRECIFDLWEIRNCFHRSYDRPLICLIAEKGSCVLGMLPLSWIEEQNYFGMFPGETWMGKTWLEQNKIPAASLRIRQELLDAAPGNVLLRYISPDYRESSYARAAIDETGYIFYPGNYHNSFTRYVTNLSLKFRKNCAREKATLEKHGVSFRYDAISDIEHLFRMNISAFGEHSYFDDVRFFNSFENLIAWLRENNMLRITTVRIGGTVAAVDIGALWNETYTVLAGGTNPEFRGVAKLINFHHLKWSCSERLKTVDFLCGDFGWKERFHLSARPLYKIVNGKTAVFNAMLPDEREVPCEL